MSAAAVLEAIRHESRLVTTDDLAALFDVKPKTITERARRGELPTPLSTHPYRWSAQQIARFLDTGGAA